MIKKQYIDYQNTKVFQIYSFQFFTIYDIESCGFDNNRKWRIGKFLDYVYRLSLRKIKDEEYREVYINDSTIVGILGKLYYKELIEFLDDNNLIVFVKKGNNKYDHNKRLSHFKMNNGFYSCKKELVNIEYGILNKWIEKRKKKIKEIYTLTNKDTEGNTIDDFVRYELECCKNSEVVIKDLSKIIETRINNKISELQNESIWSWSSKKKIKKIDNNFRERNEWEKEYSILIQNRYQTLQEDLYNIKKDNYEFLIFKRDGYGKRLYNLYSRVIKEYRGFIKIDKEDCVELDIKGSMVSCFYYLITQLNSDDCNDVFIKDIKYQLIENGNKNLGLGFLLKHKLTFEIGGVFWKENEEYEEYNDFYGFMKSCFEDNSDRLEYKKFLWYILFSETIRRRKGFLYKGYKIDDLEKLFFGNDGYELVKDLKKINLFKYIKTNKGREKKYDRGNNISLILHTIENNMMDRCRKVLMEKDIKYITMFDSFIVKKSESVTTLKMLNKELRKITSVIQFRSDVKTFKNLI